MNYPIFFLRKTLKLKFTFIFIIIIDSATHNPFRATPSGHISVVKWLINHGAKLSLDKFGKSPINDAAENQQTECLNVLVQHNSDYMMSKKQNQSHRHSTTTNVAKVERFHMNNRSFISKGSTSSDSEPFYLHPPSNKSSNNSVNGTCNSNIQPFKESFYGEKNNYYGAPMPNEGIFINPMRSNFNNPPSPSDSGESFFLHDPQEIIYNRVKDIFESDTSLKEETATKSHHKVNALTVQAEIHSSSSCTASGSDIDENHNKNHTRNEIENFKVEDTKRTANHQKQNQLQQSNLHDYEDIYLVREEAKNTRKVFDRNRSRDSGSHSRSRSSSSTRSQTVIVETNVSKLDLNEIRFYKIFLQFQVSLDSNHNYEIPRKGDKSIDQNNSMGTESTYEYVAPIDTNNKSSAANNAPAPPMPPPLPNWNSSTKTSNLFRNSTNSNRNSSDSLTDSIDLMMDGNNTESDSGLSIVEEPTIRPSEVRSKNTESMSIISGNL